ncbi:hypothetical protein ACET3Z_032512 [Daucus carota]
MRQSRAHYGRNSVLLDMCTTGKPSVTKDGDMTNIPAVVNNIVGKICAFQIKVTPYNTSHGCQEYTVTRTQEDQDADTAKLDTRTAAETSKAGANSDAHATQSHTSG